MQDLSHKQTQIDVLDPARAQAMQVVLGHTPTLKAGDALPPFFHQLYFWTPVPADGLGRDGHPTVGGLIPDMGLPRRMWAGGRLQFHAPLHFGLEARRVKCARLAILAWLRSRLVWRLMFMAWRFSPRTLRTPPTTPRGL